ncbi:helix-turn-helix transcriptional regulator [Roseibium album]|uniref:helix-turn-helix transcriptional regulator n=1 Tax=Roseibium album TaxID=311410 RepID=UPI002490CD45|nr:hypothetical protein [Roseibium album]
MTLIPLADRDGDELLPSTIVARLLGRSLNTLHRWRKSEFGPPAVKLPGVSAEGDRYAYRVADVRKFIKANIRTESATGLRQARR